MKSMLAVLSTVFICSGAVLCAEEFGQLIVQGETDRPLATVTIVAGGRRYVCTRSPAPGTLCRARVPVNVKSARVEVGESGHLPFARNFAVVEFNGSTASVSVGKVSLVKARLATDLPALESPRARPLPAVAGNGPLAVFEIIEGNAPAPNAKVFDVYLINTGKQTILKEFEIGWSYMSGGTASGVEAFTPKPVGEYVLELPIRLSNPSSRRTQRLPAPLVIPAGTVAEPNPVVLRLVIFYSLQDADRHPYSGWNIKYSLRLVSYDGGSIPIFLEESCPIFSEESGRDSKY